MFTFLIALLQICLIYALEAFSAKDIVAKPISLVYFYTRGCRFCAESNPSIDYLSEVYNHNEDFQIVKVNGRVSRDLLQMFQVLSYPTVKIYDDVKKTVTSYNGDRLVELLQKFIEESSNAVPDYSKTKLPATSIMTMDDLHSLGSDKPLLIAFVEQHSVEWKHCFRPFHFYQALAQNSPNLHFAIARMNEVGSDVLRHFRVSHSPSLVYIDKKAIGTYGTFEGGANRISEGEIRTFLSLDKTHEFGVWFPNLQSLHKHAEMAISSSEEAFMPMKQVAGKTNDFSDDINEQYDQLVVQISL